MNFNLEDLENYVKGEYNSINRYLEAGGREILKKELLTLQEVNEIEVVSSRKKEKHPLIKLPIHWRKVKKKHEEQWNRSDILNYSVYLNLSSFVNYPEQQTEENWSRLTPLYHYLKNKKDPSVITTEERMYQLFKNEKWLTPKEGNGINFLTKIGLTIEDLDAKKFPEPIPYETRGRIPLSQVKTVLVIENNSFYHSVRRYLQEESQIIDLEIDMIVYARGKQTIANLEYLYTLFDNAAEKVYYYVGDIDPEGISIYAKVKRKYSDLSFGIAKGIYKWMMKVELNPPGIEKEQKENKVDYELFLDEFQGESDEFYRNKLKTMWEEKKRIPQEVTNYEMLKAKGWNHVNF